MMFLFKLEGGQYIDGEYAESEYANEKSQFKSI